MNIKELYRKNIYGVMGALIFHILLVIGLWVGELNQSIKTKKEEIILLDFTAPEIRNELKDKQDKQNPKEKASRLDNKNVNTGSNRAANDAAKKDRFFDESYRQDIKDAQNLVSEVNKQLSKKTNQIKKFEMPEVSSEGQNRDSVKNIIYSGKSNIHYYLENRFHLRIPIPVYLAKGGGEITVDIQVDRAGNVIKALARNGKNISDPMLPTYAVQAAERTIFNSEIKAPSIQKGTITYYFVSQ
jgi:hypothetical protein